MTIQEALDRAARQLKKAGIGQPRLEAESLFAHASGKDAAWILAHPENAAPISVMRRYRKMLAARTRRAPFAYVVGTKPFYGREFLVTPDVLIPRPETEALVEAGVEAVKAARPEAVAIFDLGTGSGAIGLALASELPASRAVLADVSAKALAVARRNAKRLGVARHTRFLRLDALKPSKPPRLPSGFLILAANLPYLPAARMKRLSPEVRREPRLALVSGADGLRHYRALADRLREWKLAPDLLLIEAEPGQMTRLETLFAPVLSRHRFRRIKDLFGDDRILAAQLV